MVRSSIVIAMVMAASLAVVAAQPSFMPDMVFNKPYKGARPLPGVLNGAEKTYMEIMLRVVFEGQLTIGNPSADPSARAALEQAALAVLADAGDSAAGIIGSNPFDGYELSINPPVMYQNNEGEKEIMFMGQVYKTDGSDFPKDAEDMLRAPFDMFASNQMNLGNDATTSIGMTAVYIKQDPSTGGAAGYVLDYIKQGEPMPRPPSARALFDGKIVTSNAPVDLNMLSNVLPLVLSGCLTEFNLGLNPTNFHLLGGLSFPSDEGQVTLFRAAIEVNHDMYREVGGGLDMALEMCVANQLGGATGGGMAWASAPLKAAFVGDSRYRSDEDGGTLAFYVEQTEAQYDEVIENFEMLYVASQQALNAVLEWGVMSQNRDPYGARANISNFDIITHGHFMFPEGPRSGFVLRAFGMENVDFPETSGMLWHVMGSAFGEFLGMVDLIEGEAVVAPFGMSDEQEYRDNNPNGSENDPFVALGVTIEITAGQEDDAWRWAETRAKAAFLFYVINSLEGTDAEMGQNVEVITDVQITTLDMSTFTYSTFIRASSKAIADAIKDNIMDNEDVLATLLGGGAAVAVRSVRGMGRDYQMDGRPSHFGLHRLVGVLSFSGLMVQHADTDVFRGAVAEAVALASGSQKGDAAVVGCVATDKMEFVCQVELAVDEPTTTSEFTAMLTAFVGVPPALESMLAPIWGNQLAVTTECEHCMAAFRPAWFSDQDVLEMQFRYYDLRVRDFDMRGPATGGNLRTLYGLALMQAFDDMASVQLDLGQFVLEENWDGVRVKLNNINEGDRSDIENNHRDISYKIADYLKAWGDLDATPRFDDDNNGGGNNNCIPNVFRYDRQDGSEARVATNDCYSMFPSDQCDNANTIDDGRGNTYWLMGSWDSYANLQVCN